MIIGDFDTTERPLLIAEIGNNHEGRIDVARTLVKRAAEVGVKAVKFQTFRTELYIDRRESARFERLRGFELTGDQFAELSKLARSLGLLFISTPLDLSSATMLEPLVDAYKIASGDNDFFPLIDQVARTGKPMIVSTGASDSTHISAAIDCIRSARGSRPGPPKNVALLHCVSAYPVPPGQANLRAIPTLAAEFGLPVGYSDHTVGLDACLIAVALGATIVEKHFTLDHHFSDFRDHQLSAEPDEMKGLQRRILEAHSMLGDGVKSPQKCEDQIGPIIRRSTIVVNNLPAGHTLSLEDLAWVRPAGGLPPASDSQVVGRRLRRDLSKGERLELSDLE
jgi:N,N'-diacetyllegionaminate synthase